MIDKLQSRTARARASEPRVCRLDSESATTTIEAISADTAREILSLLHDEPMPASELADALEASIPTVDYHVQNLVDAGLVEQVDTRYSVKGREMTVYAPVDDPLVFVGERDRTESVRSLLARVAGAFVLLLGGSLLAQWITTDALRSLWGPTGIRKAVSAGTVDGVSVTPIPPGLLFFSGGTFVLAVVVVLWYLTARVGSGPTG